MENLKHVLMQILKKEKAPRVWILNQKYCVDNWMDENNVCVYYSYNPQKATPFSVEAILDIESYDFKTFKKAYVEERREILGANDTDNVNELRINSVWSFYHNVKKGDILLYVTSNEIDGYWTVLDDEFECVKVKAEDACIHSRNAQYVRFPRPVMIKERFGSPFLKILTSEFLTQILKAIQNN